MCRGTMRSLKCNLVIRYLRVRFIAGIEQFGDSKSQSIILTHRPSLTGKNREEACGKVDCPVGFQCDEVWLLIIVVLLLIYRIFLVPICQYRGWWPRCHCKLHNSSEWSIYFPCTFQSMLRHLLQWLGNSIQGGFIRSLLSSRGITPGDHYLLQLTNVKCEDFLEKRRRREILSTRQQDSTSGLTSQMQTLNGTFSTSILYLPNELSCVFGSTTIWVLRRGRFIWSWPLLHWRPLKRKASVQNVHRPRLRKIFSNHTSAWIGTQST